MKCVEDEKAAAAGCELDQLISKVDTEIANLEKPFAGLASAASERVELPNSNGRLLRVKPDNVPTLTERVEITHEAVEQATWFRKRFEGGIGARTIAVLGCLGFVVCVVLIASLRTKTEVQTLEMTNSDPAELPSGVGIEQARQLLKDLTDSATVAERLALVRHPHMTAPRMERFYANTQRSLGRLKFARGHTNVTHISGTNLLVFDYRFGFESWKTAVVEQTQDGLKLDWEGFSSYEEIPFPEFISSSSMSPQTYRLTIRDGNYYNFRYQEREFKAFEVRNGWHTCWAYARRSSKVLKDLEFLFSKGQRLKGTRASTVHATVSDNGRIGPGAIKAMVQIRSDDASEPQVLIEDIVSENWIDPDPHCQSTESSTPDYVQTQ